MNRSISLKYGLIAGGSVVLYFLLFYFFRKEDMLKIWVAYSSLLIYVFFMIRAVSVQRALLEEIISFREALSVAFTTFIVANAVYYVFYYFILKSDPQLVAMLKQTSIDFYRRVLSDKNSTEFEKTFENFDVNLSMIALSFARGAIGGFILSALIAATMRRGKRLKV